MADKSRILDYGGDDLRVRSLTTGFSKPNSAAAASALGALTVTGPLIGSADTLTGAGAVSLTTLVTIIVSTGANALTLADGVTGQIKILTMKTDGGDATLAPTNKNFTSLVFNDVGDSAILIFDGAKWNVVSNNGGTLT